MVASGNTNKLSSFETYLLMAGAGLVAVGGGAVEAGTGIGAAVWTSRDGVTWSRVPHDEGVFAGPCLLEKVAAAQPSETLLAAPGPQRLLCCWAAQGGGSRYCSPDLMSPRCPSLEEE